MGKGKGTARVFHAEASVEEPLGGRACDGSCPAVGSGGGASAARYRQGKGSKELAWTPGGGPGIEENASPPPG